MELLAPCSSKETFYAALNAGADAIYLGGKNYSARAYAENFSYEDIKECIISAHAINVKIHIAVNTLLFADEIEDCINECVKYIELGVDALIIQDLGLIYRLHMMYPDFPIHASTQLNVHNLNEAKMLKELGVKRIVMARETNIKDIKEIIDKTHLEVEVFVHGALCVSGSGQCLMSSFIGNRSGNRGKCAQPCRLEGKIVSENGEAIKDQYPLSMKDLCALDYLDYLEKIGVSSIKIEGRMKNKEYIFHTVRTYRKALDKVLNDIDREKKVLKTVFNRGYTKGFIFDEKNNRTLNQKSSSHIGVVLGKVKKLGKHSFFIVLNEDLSLHDGLRDINIQDGFLLTHFKFKGNDVHFAKKGDYVEIISPIKNIKVDDIIVKTRSKELENVVEENLKKKRKLDINAFFTAKENQEMTLTLYENDVFYSFSSKIKLEKSKTVFTSSDDLKERLNKSDIYPYNLKTIDFDIEPGLFYPLKELNELRKNAFKGFYELKLEMNHQSYQLCSIKNNIKKLPLESKEIVSVEKEEQLFEVLKYPFETIYLPYSLFVKYRDSDSRLKLMNKRMGKDFLETENSLSPYISKKGEILSPYANITNHFALACALNNNYKNVILSYELSFEDALKIKQNFKNIYEKDLNVYFPIYGHIDYMLIKSCPIATGYKKEPKCGLCRKNDYYYVDRLGVKYPLKTDEECFIRVLSPKPLSLIAKKNVINADFIPYFAFTIENKETTKSVLEAYFSDEAETYAYFEGHFYKSPL